VDRKDLTEASCVDQDKRPQSPTKWRVPFERLEAVVPELPFGLGDAPFEAVNLCIDVGSVIGAHGQEDERAVAGALLAAAAHYRHFFWERRGVITELFVYWSGADAPGWAGAVLALVREVLRAVPCAYAVDIGVASARALPLWVVQSERFGAVTGTPTVVLTTVKPGVDACDAEVATPRETVYILVVEGNGARFLPVAWQTTGLCKDADAARIEAQLVDKDDADPDSVKTLIAERLGPTDIPVGHLFDGADQWG